MRNSYFQSPRNVDMASDDERVKEYVKCRTLDDYSKSGQSHWCERFTEDHAMFDRLRQKCVSEGDVVLDNITADKFYRMTLPAMITDEELLDILLDRQKPGLAPMAEILKEQRKCHDAQVTPEQIKALNDRIDELENEQVDFKWLDSLEDRVIELEDNGEVDGVWDDLTKLDTEHDKLMKACVTFAQEILKIRPPPPPPVLTKKRKTPAELREERNEQVDRAKRHCVF
jgi:hypothetical protein